MRKRLFEPVDAERLEHPGDLRRGRDIPARLEIAGHPPPLVGVDHDLEVAPDGVADRLDDPDVVAPVGMMEADLDGLHARVAERDATAGALVGLDELSARDVREQPLGAAAEELPDRLSRRLAEQRPRQRPRRSRHRPPWKSTVSSSSRTSSVRKGSRPTRSDSSCSWSGSASPLAQPVTPSSGVNADERRLLVVARDRIPRGAKRRVEARRDSVGSRRP